MKSCSRCYIIASKLFDIKELTPLSPKYHTPYQILGICLRCVSEVKEGIFGTQPYETTEAK